MLHPEAKKKNENKSSNECLFAACQLKHAKNHSENHVPRKRRFVHFAASFSGEAAEPAGIPSSIPDFDNPLLTWEIPVIRRL